MNPNKIRIFYWLLLLFTGFLFVTAPATAQLGGLGLGNPVGNTPLNGGAQRSGIGNSRLQISNGISNGTISLSPDAPAPGTSLTPGTGITAPVMSTFGSPGGGPGGGGNPPGGGYFSAPLDGGAIILIMLGIGLFLQLRLLELRKRGV